jgi:hypothetical protein
MSTEIICPECGGIIGASPGGDEGGSPCTCSASSSTFDVPTGFVGKLCVNCGINITNAKRLKDKEGNYWCAACALENSRKKKEAAIKAGGGGVICPDCCGRFPRDSMFRAGADLICQACRTKRIIGGKKVATRLYSSVSGPKRGRKHQFDVAFATFVGILLMVAILWNLL